MGAGCPSVSLLCSATRDIASVSCLCTQQHLKKCFSQNIETKPKCCCLSKCRGDDSWEVRVKSGKVCKKCLWVVEWCNPLGSSQRFEVSPPLTFHLKTGKLHAGIATPDFHVPEGCCSVGCPPLLLPRAPTGAALNTKGQKPLAPPQRNDSTPPARDTFRSAGKQLKPWVVLQHPAS